MIVEVDRKGNIEELETTKNVNKEEIKKLREENSNLRMKLAQTQRVNEFAIVCIGICISFVFFNVEFRPSPWKMKIKLRNT
jgi:hypothetical protein